MKKAALLIPIILLGCSKHKDDPAPPPPPPAPVEQPKVLSICDQNKAPYLQRTDLINEPMVTVAIERQFQRVIRLNCDGTVASDKIETVQSPRANVILKPSKRLQRDASIVKLLGSETCDKDSSQLPNIDIPIIGQTAAITGKANGEIKVKMDMAEAWFTHKVTTGLNHIFYSYYDSCENDKFPEACGPRNEILSGIYNVFVNYTEKTLPGQQTIPASASDCQKKN